MSSVISPSEHAYHQAASDEAKEIYIAGLAPAPLAEEWRQVCRQVRRSILRALIDTNGLRDIEAALIRSGRPLLVLRHLFAPPISQDQMKLALPSYPKSAEIKGSRVSVKAAKEFSAAFSERRDRSLTGWLSTNSDPSRRQIRKILHTLTPMISSQIFNTARRNRLADEQEKAVEVFLAAKGWDKARSIPISGPSDILPKTYMRKTRCQSSPTAKKEVDIACGIKSNLIMAMECKVSNDATNSVKRIHDVTDKTKSWAIQWGNMIQTAAMLQGVIAYKDVKQLLDQNVLVFWSHDLEPLGIWLESHT